MTRWPALMRVRTAAEYVDMPLAAFQREVAAGRLPAPFIFGGKEHWRKDAIDKALDVLTGGADTMPEYRRKLQERCGKAA